MSSSSRNTTASSVSATKPYCKVCRDAGRPEEEYTNHFVKDQPGPQGKVICPTLLNQHCRICDKTGHTSSYCPQYRSSREEPRREERYIEREQPRREERYIEREQPRREERYIEREQPRREERYIEREQPRREERYIEREQPRRDSYDRLREDTERRERESRERDVAYYREQDRRAKPWLQAALKPATTNESRQQQRREPYAHPHGPRVRLSLEAPALSAAKHADPVIDVRKVELNHASNWGDEDANQPFVCDPEQMTRKFLEECLMANLTTSKEHGFMAECDDQSEMPFMCGQ